MLSSVLAADAAPATGGFDPMLILVVVIGAVLLFFMFRKNKAAKKAQAQQQSQLVPAAEVMTNYGLFGTVVSIDAEENKVVLELSPGNFATVHKATITKITAPETAADTIPDDASSLTGPGEESDTSAESADDTLKRLNRDSSTDN
ncbi:MAG: preprotein translocase subunit YajC [Actinomycetales bacterium]